MSADARTLRALVLGLWACFFAGLWVSGKASHYLGPRTLWVVPFGACALSLLAIAYAFSVRRSHSPRQPLGIYETVGTFALLLPIALVLLMPDAQLGAFAASRNVDGGYFRTLAPRPPASRADISFLDLRVADGDATFAQEAGIRHGVRVRLVGFDTGSKPGPPGTFELARFYITCCVADAIAVGVPVETAQATGAAEATEDAWLLVTGTLVRKRDRWTVTADHINQVKPPAKPYFSFLT
jgi:uncharacterized repeat protein (TIGR03943 family)